MGDIGLIMVGVAYMTTWAVLSFVKFAPWFTNSKNKHAADVVFLKFVSIFIFLSALSAWIAMLSVPNGTYNNINYSAIAFAFWIMFLTYVMEMFCFNTVSFMALTHFRGVMMICFATGGFVLYGAASDPVNLPKLYNVTTVNATTGAQMPVYTFTAAQLALIPVNQNIMNWMYFFVSAFYLAAFALPAPLSVGFYNLANVTIGALGGWTIFTAEYVQDSYGTGATPNTMAPIAVLMLFSFFFATLFIQSAVLWLFPGSGFTFGDMMPGSEDKESALVTQFAYSKPGAMVSGIRNKADGVRQSYERLFSNGVSRRVAPLDG